MKKILAIHIVFLGVFFLTGCDKQTISQDPITSSKKINNEVFVPSVDEFESWQTYQNIELGFEMKYPQKNWMTSDDEPNSGIFCEGIRKIDENTNMSYIDSQAGIHIYSIDNPNNLSIQELFDKWNKNCIADMENGNNEFGCIDAENISEWEKIIIDGIPAFRSGMRPIPEGIPTNDVYIKLPNKYIVLSAFSGPYNNDKECLEINSIFDKMLSTFKFTK